MVDELIKFARAHHPGFEGLPEKTMRALFETYKKTTLVWRENGAVRGFAIYQEWPDLLNIIAIAGIGSKLENLKAILRGRKQLPQKMICWFDESSMELKILCHKRQQDGRH